ncbi:MAG: hypothetical protein LBI09_01690, partial [Nitrososphaerota archaeon]|nr:hypothetical protein [Nitrososphaerota archaeon]
GIATIPNLNGECILTLSSLITGTNIDYVVIPVDPATGRDNTVKHLPTDSTVIQPQSSRVDYVFVEVGNTSNFKVLQVVTGAVVVPGGVNINITFNIVDGTPVLSQATGSFSQSDYYNGDIVPLSINVTSPGVTNIQWHFNGNVYANPLNLTATGIGGGTDISHLVEGEHTFTVYATTGGLTYSANFTLTVTP